MEGRGWEEESDTASEEGVMEATVGEREGRERIALREQKRGWKGKETKFCGSKIGTYNACITAYINVCITAQCTACLMRCTYNAFI